MCNLKVVCTVKGVSNVTLLWLNQIVVNRDMFVSVHLYILISIGHGQLSCLTENMHVSVILNRQHDSYQRIQ